MVHRSLSTLLAIAALAGCGPTPGSAGLWDLRVGGAAQVIGDEGASDVVLRRLVAASDGRRPRKKATPTVEIVSLAVKTRVTVLAVDGDDARIRIEEGPWAGSIDWIECRRLASPD